MTATGRKPGRRYSREQQQEDRSEGQLKDRFAALGWPCDRLGRDLGEDLNVRIYDEGASTGLTFLVQLKSTADSAALKRKRSAALAYPLEVKDLLHWEVSVTLVVLVVWDVEKQTGWWRSVPEIIKDLDATTKGWRKEKTAAVSVPVANGTDEEGLRQLRWAVADHSLPLVLQKNEMSELTLLFPKTPEGKASLAALIRAFDEDEAVILGDGGLIAPKIEYSAWHRRLYGEFDRPIQIEIHASNLTATKSIPVRVEAESPVGVATLQIELRLIRNGRRRRVFSNEHQKAPFKFVFDSVPDGDNSSLSFVHLGKDAYEAKEAAQFAWVIAHAGAELRFTASTRSRPTHRLRLEDKADKAILAKFARWREFVERLWFVQQRLRDQQILIPREGVTHADAAAVERIFGILSRGSEQASFSIKASLAPEPVAPQFREPRAEKGAFSLGGGDSEPIKFLNCIFDPGHYRVIPADAAAFMERYGQWQEDARRAGKAIPVSLKNLPVILEYIEWVPAETRWEHLSELAARQEGYCTFSQARWVGYTDDVFLALLHAGKTERVATDIFRLVQYPPSDHEPIIALWLQTDRRGIISHDTALFLHEISDVLPRRRHVTVPPGWDPGDRKFDGRVVLHQAEVGEDEICWLGPVPYTAPLRTVRDCIASHLSPDLIEQAIADGLRLGMFTEADLLPLDVHQGAA